MDSHVTLEGTDEFNRQHRSMAYWLVCCDTYWRARQGVRRSWICDHCGSEGHISYTGPMLLSPHHYMPDIERTQAERWVDGEFTSTVGFLIGHNDEPG